ncbi:MAG: hypothetical protein ACNA8H_11685 [Anaerolineales bacterium]
MSQTRNIPDLDRMSVVVATILLAYGLSRFVVLPVRELSFQLPGLYLSVQVNENTMIGFLVASLTATGSDWLLQDHPAQKSKKTYQHLILPGLTAWVIAVTLLQLPFGLQWVIGFVISSTLLILVIVAEYIAVDPDDLRHPIATAFLVAISFTFYLVLAIALRSAEVRLFLMLPAMTFAGALVALRTLHLRLQGRWLFGLALVLAVIIAQITAALHYWPLKPITFGLVLLAPAYALTALAVNLAEGDPFRQAIIEPAVVTLVIWGLAVWIQ